MDVVMATDVGVIVAGLVVMVLGYLARHTGGPFLLFFGAALIVGPMSPLMKGRVTDTVQILFSVGAIVLALAGLVTGLAEVRRRRAHKSHSH